MALPAEVAFLGPMLEPLLLEIEQQVVQPKIKAYLASKDPNSDLYQGLAMLDKFLDEFAQLEIGKLAPTPAPTSGAAT